MCHEVGETIGVMQGTFVKVNLDLFRFFKCNWKSLETLSQETCDFSFKIIDGETCVTWNKVHFLSSFSPLLPFKKTDSYTSLFSRQPNHIQLSPTGCVRSE